MMGNLVARIVSTLLRSVDLSVSARSLLTATLLDKLKALPASAILSKDEEGTLLVRGRRLTVQHAIALRHSALSVINSPIWKLIYPEVQHRAIQIGVHKALDADQVFFSKAALYELQEIQSILEEFAQGASEDDEDNEV
jgi:hypothetical protein